MAAPTLFCEVLVGYVWVLQSRAHIAVTRHGAAEPREIDADPESFRIPLTMRSANFLSGGWVCSTCSHARQSHGVETSERKAGVGRRGDGCIAKRLSCPVSGALLRRPNSCSGTPAPARIQRDQKKGKRLRKKKRLRVELSHPKVERQPATHSYPDPVCIRMLLCPRSARIHNNVHNKGEA